MKRQVAILLLALSVLGVGLARAQVPATVGVTSPPAQAEPDIDQWLMRMHEAARQRTYVGTFVVTAGNFMSSSRIWHVCDGCLLYTSRCV